MISTVKSHWQYENLKITLKVKQKLLSVKTVYLSKYHSFIDNNFLYKKFKLCSITSFTSVLVMFFTEVLYDYLPEVCRKGASFLATCKKSVVVAVIVVILQIGP